MSISGKEINVGSYVVITNVRTFDYSLYKISDGDAGLVKSTWSRKCRKSLLSDKYNEYDVSSTSQLGQALIGKKQHDFVEVKNDADKVERYMIVWCSDKAPKAGTAFDDIVAKETRHMSVEQRYDKKLVAYQKHMREKYGADNA